MFIDASRAIERLDLDGDAALCEFLLEETGVALVPGTAFGAPGHVRISFACGLDTLKDAVERLRRVLPSDD